MYLTESGYATVGDLAGKLPAKKPVKKLVKLIRKSTKKLTPITVTKKPLLKTVTSHKRPELSRTPPKETTPAGLVSWRTATLAPSTGSTALAIGPRPEVISVGTSERWEAAATRYFPQNRQVRSEVQMYKSTPSMTACALSGLGEDTGSVNPWVVALLIAAVVNLSIQAVNAYSAWAVG